MNSKFKPYLAKTKEEALENLALIRAELERRRKQVFDLKKYCTTPEGVLYEKQYNAIIDPALFQTETTTRRSGKTSGRIGDHIETAMKFPKSNSVYITTTRSNAKKIMFPALCEAVRQHNIPATPNISDLSMGFHNHSNVYLAGVNDEQSIHNFRGMKLHLGTIDEAQSMRPYVKELIDDVLAPALFDCNGRLRVTGTPGPVPVGFFYDISHSKEWNHHFYSLFDNPFLKDQLVRLQLELKRRGVSIDDPSIQREFFGKWATDLSALVLKYNPDLNHFDQLPTTVAWEYIIVADFGFDDADAIAVIAFSTQHPNAYLVEEHIMTKQGITPLANQLIDRIQKYNPMKVLGDFGGLGKKIASELQVRFNIPIEAAEKSRKLEYIELLNDSLRTGRMKAKKDSRFAQDAMLLEWDRTNPEKPKISDSYHSDIGDCMIYGHRELLHWLWKEEVPAAKPGSQEFMNQEEQDIWDEVRQKHYQSKEEQMFWQDPFEYDT